MKLIFKQKTNTEKLFKCYKCGCISYKALKYCPICSEKGCMNRMMVLIEKMN